MAGDRQNSADVSAMMEALWGPRRGGFTGPDVGPAAPTVERARAGAGAKNVSSPDGEALQAEIAALRSELSATVAAVEATLSERIEGLARADAEVTAGSTEVIASVRADLAALAVALEATDERHRQSQKAVGAELQRLAMASESAGADRVTTHDLDGLRNEIAELMLVALAELEARTVTPADVAELRADLESLMVEQLRLVVAESVDARAGEIADVSRPMERSVAMEEFAALRSELRNALARNMSSAQAELKRRISVLDATVVDLKLQVTARLERMATLVAAEAAAAAERATAAVLQQSPPPGRPRREHRRRRTG